jgi:hypoxia up-regulated 1
MFGIRRKKTQPAFVPKEKKRLHKKTLDVETYNVGKVQPMSAELMAESKAKMEELARVDNDRIMLEEAKNKVESYIYKIKNKLIDHEDAVAKVTTEEQIAELNKLSVDGEAWLDDEGYGADLATMQAKYAELSEPAEKVWFRMAETTARPEAIASLTTKLDKVEEFLKKWETSMPHITDEERSDAQEKVDEVRKWISEKESEQAGKEATEEPAFTSEEVPMQTKALERIMSKLSKKPKPKPVKKAEEKNETETEESKENLDEKKEGDEEKADDEAATDEATTDEAASDETAEEAKTEDGDKKGDDEL